MYKNKAIRSILEESLEIVLDYKSNIGQHIPELGKIIGEGNFSIAVKMDNYDFLNHNLKNPILIITTEEEKEDMISSIIGSGVFSFDIENIMEEKERIWLQNNGYNSMAEANDDEMYYYESSEYAEHENLNILYFLKIEDSLHFYLIEEMETISDEISKSFLNEEVIEYALDILSETYLGGGSYLKCQLDENIDIEEEVIEISEEILSQGANKDLVKKSLNLIEIIQRDFNKAKNVLDDNTKISLDIHYGQFAKLDNNIYCIDPLVIIK